MTSTDETLTRGHSRLAQGKEGIATASSSSTEIKLLHDIDQPFVYDIRMYNRPYRFEFYDTASPQSYTLLQPDLVVLCYDIGNRATLADVQNDWRKQVYLHYYRREDRIPVMLLGLKRDLRVRMEREKGMVDPLEVNSNVPGVFGKPSGKVHEWLTRSPCD